MAYSFDHCFKEGRRLKLEGLRTEELLRFFRANGASITESMKLLGRLENVTLGEAKRIVHFSQTWEDFRDDSEDLQERAERAARDLAADPSKNGNVEED